MFPAALQSPRGRRVLFAGAVLAQLVALYWPRPVDPGPGLPWDKLVHLAIFGAVMWTGVRVGIRAPLLAALLVVHAGVSEVVQGTLLDRDGNVPDAVADTLGVALAWAAAVVTGAGADDAVPDRR